MLRDERHCALRSRGRDVADRMAESTRALVVRVEVEDDVVGAAIRVVGIGFEATLGNSGRQVV